MNSDCDEISDSNPLLVRGSISVASFKVSWKRKQTLQHHDTKVKWVFQGSSAMGIQVLWYLSHRNPCFNTKDIDFTFKALMNCSVSSVVENRKANFWICKENREWGGFDLFHSVGQKYILLKPTNKCYLPHQHRLCSWQILLWCPWKGIQRCMTPEARRSATWKRNVPPATRLFVIISSFQND